ncbi:hypothetical protein EXS74_00100 [Candidatus Woesearchaeota archaeon]|nr:hypothetical protein [Candidatus Woesearchaeota archaeon]
MRKFNLSKFNPKGGVSDFHEDVYSIQDGKSFQLKDEEYRSLTQCKVTPLIIVRGCVLKERWLYSGLALEFSSSSYGHSRGLDGYAKESGIELIVQENINRSGDVEIPSESIIFNFQVMQLMGETKLRKDLLFPTFLRKSIELVKEYNSRRSGGTFWEKRTFKSNVKRYIHDFGVSYPYTYYSPLTGGERVTLVERRVENIITDCLERYDETYEKFNYEEQVKLDFPI